MTNRGFRIRRRARRIVVAVGSVLGLAFLVLWLAVHRKPAWFVPIPTDATLLSWAQRHSTTLADQISRALVESRSISLELTDEELNGYLASLTGLWPGVARHVPRSVREAVVALEPDKIRVGVLIETGFWRVVVSAAVQPILTQDGDFMEWSVVEPRLGAVPLPVSWAFSPLNRLGVGSDPVMSTGWTVQRRGLEVNLGLTPSEPGPRTWRSREVWRMRGPNHFIWPNGRRPYRIADLKINSGRLMLRLESERR